jgi:plasmid stabilization system protein ParE
MNYKVELLPRARRELLEAWDWYDDKWSGLGDRFILEIERKLQQIGQTPERYPERKKGFRETSIKIFPYLIIYRIQKRKRIVAISSIFHFSRNPNKKYSGGK